MVQMYLNLAPAGPAVFGQTFDNAPLILFGGIKVGVTERLAVAIRPGFDQ
jgi:hypothetical protein